MALLLERVIGFCITKLNGQREAAVDFVVKYGFVSRAQARDMVDAPVLVSVYAKGISTALLALQPFEATTIILRVGLNVVSTTNAKLELPTPQGQTITLPATWMIRVDSSYETYWSYYAEKGLIRFIAFNGLNTDFSPADYRPTDYLV